MSKQQTEGIKYNYVAEEDVERYINTAQDLWDFAEEVNSGNTFDGVTVYLTADIDLGCTEEKQWIPIGKYISTKQSGFNGVFDGQQHSITGIYIDTEDSYQGLFGFNTGIIKNVNVINSYIWGINNIGGIVGENYGDDEYEGLVYNCTYSGTIIAGKSYNGTAKGCNCVGGIVGYNFKGIIEYCENFANITTIAGGSATGGITGLNSHGTINNCSNSGILSASSGGGLGGISGDNWGMIYQCYNLGDASSSCAGGIAVQNTHGAIIEECYNIGHINSYGSSDSSYAGGIVGYISGLATDISKIKNCYNIGTISGNKNLGGICGYIGSQYANIEKNYNVGKIIGSSNMGTIIRKK